VDNLQEFVSNRIKTLRTNEKISARELSLAIGQGHGYINQIEKGNHLPSLDGLSYICDYFHISLADFFNEDIEYPGFIDKMILYCRKLDTESINYLMLFLRSILKND